MGTSRVTDDGGRGLPALDPAVPTVDGACCASGETLAMAAPTSGPGGAGAPWRARWPSSRCPSRGPRGLPRQSQWRDPVLLRRGRRARVDGGGGDASVPV